MHWSCHTAVFLPYPQHISEKTGRLDCNTNFGSSTRSNNADPEPVAFSSYIIQCLKRSSNLYTVVNASTTCFTFAPGSFQFNAVLLYFLLPNPPPTQEKLRQN